MDSPAVVNQENSETLEPVDNGRQIPNDPSVCIISSDSSGVRASGGSFYVGDKSDDLLPGSNNGSNSKRKYGSEDENCSVNEEDDIVPKMPKLETPILVAPLHFVKPPQPVNSLSSLELVLVKVENFSLPETLPLSICSMENFTDNSEVAPVIHSCRQFWKAGDYEGNSGSDPTSSSVGMDHVRVHPKFLHSNATSHKWALGAFAELLDNSLDEVCNGATYVHIDMLENAKDGSRLLLVEDDGGGMGPDKMRHCMSLGYSSKRKMPNTIGQYGNGFKTSTMRLGADVIVFSRCQGNDQRGPTQSIGMLSYTFLRGTGKEDIVVPMVDFEFKGECWNKMMRSEDDWNRNLETIARWSPYASKENLLEQFNCLKDHGTRIIIYNLWEDDEGDLELDFNTDPHDIQIRGVNRDEKNIKMAQLYPNSRHFLTYRHSLRTYASILYLRLPSEFRVILRGKAIEHHNIVNNLMLTKEITYRPQQLPTGTVQKRSDMLVTVTIGFVKDARSHIDVQGFNVYHKNRLIKPFWRIWNAAGSNGRGVIGVLEANFVEPAHDKQSFERTSVLSRLESRLVQMQKSYWSQNCQEVGYAARRRPVGSSLRGLSESNVNMDESTSQSNRNGQNTSGSTSVLPALNSSVKSEKIVSPPVNIASTGVGNNARSTPNASSSPQQIPASTGRVHQMSVQPRSHPIAINSNGKVLANNDAASLMKAKEGQCNPGGRITDPRLGNLLNCLRNERCKCKSLENQVLCLKKQLNEANQKLEEKEKEHMLLTSKRDYEGENLRKSLLAASTTINELLLRISRLENCNNLSTSKNEP